MIQKRDVIYDMVYIYESDSINESTISNLLKYEKYLLNEYSNIETFKYRSFSTKIKTHLLGFHYDLFSAIPELNELKKDMIDAFIDMSPESGTYAIHSWVNIGYEGDFINWHHHITKYFSFIYVDIRDSYTLMKIHGINDEITLTRDCGNIIITKGIITPHRTSVWNHNDSQRITIAVNFIDISETASEHDIEYMKRFEVECDLETICIQ